MAKRAKVEGNKFPQDPMWNGWLESGGYSPIDSEAGSTDQSPADNDRQWKSVDEMLITDSDHDDEDRVRIVDPADYDTMSEYGSVSDGGAATPRGSDGPPGEEDAAINTPIRGSPLKEGSEVVSQQESTATETSLIQSLENKDGTSYRSLTNLKVILKVEDNDTVTDGVSWGRWVKIWKNKNLRELVEGSSMTATLRNGSTIAGVGRLVSPAIVFKTQGDNNDFYVDFGDVDEVELSVGSTEVSQEKNISSAPLPSIDTTRKRQHEEWLKDSTDSCSEKGDKTSNQVMMELSSTSEEEDKVTNEEEVSDKIDEEDKADIEEEIKGKVKVHNDGGGKEEHANWEREETNNEFFRLLDKLAFPDP